MTSPVDMAKSYMQSRPPWRPLSSNNFEFRTPPPIHNYMDENSHPMACYSLPSTKVLNRYTLSYFLLSWQELNHLFPIMDSFLPMFQLDTWKYEMLFSLVLVYQSKKEKKYINLAADNLCCFNFTLYMYMHFWKI